MANTVLLNAIAGLQAAKTACAVMLDQQTAFTGDDDGCNVPLARSQVASVLTAACMLTSAGAGLSRDFGARFWCEVT